MLSYKVTQLTEQGEAFHAGSSSLPMPSETNESRQGAWCHPTCSSPSACHSAAACAEGPSSRSAAGPQGCMLNGLAEGFQHGSHSRNVMQTRHLLPHQLGHVSELAPEKIGQGSQGLQQTEGEGGHGNNNVTMSFSIWSAG